MPLRSSSAAEFQSLQTRARMAGALWSRAVRAIILTWIALTLWLIWYRVGLYRPWLHHAYFGRWMLCGIINDTPLLKHFAARIPVPAAGGWWTLPSFVGWLNSSQMYGDSFYSWFWHMATGLGGYYGIGTDLFLLGISALLIAWRLTRQPDAVDHLRGLRLLTPGRHARTLHPYRRRLAALNRPAGGSGIKLGASVIPPGMQFEHFAVFGTAGSGKSTLHRQMLRQIQDRGQPAIILDVEGESTMEFYHPERGDVILNPLDARCPFWSPRLEFRADMLPMDIAAMAASLIRNLPKTPTEEFFFKSGRAVLRSVFSIITDLDPAAINRLMGLPRAELHKQLEGTPACALVDPNMKETGEGIIATVINAVEPFDHLPRSEQEAGGRSWSAREWAQSRRGWVFLPSRADTEAAIQSLQGVWLDCLVRWLMSSEIGGEQVWIFADELPAMGYQPQIEQLVTRGRKRGIAAVLGFQNVSQLRKIYSHDGAVTLTSSPTTKVVLRADEPETARWCSELIGHHEVERLQMTQMAGLSTYREGVNLSPHRSVEPLVLPAQIQRLKPFHGYLCIAGEDRTTIEVPPLRLTRHHEAFIPRRTTSAPIAKGEPAEDEILKLIMPQPKAAGE